MTAESIVNFDLTLSLASLWYQLVRPIISSRKLKSVTEKDPHHTPSLSLTQKVNHSSRHTATQFLHQFNDLLDSETVATWSSARSSSHIYKPHNASRPYNEQ
jgi:hypothetical protein